MEKIAFLFPGQGSQYIGMSKNLCHEFEIARRTFEQANEVLGYDLRKICFEGPLGELGRTEHALPALLTSGVAQFRVYMQEVGILPHMSCGHSLGEYTALTCSGAILFRDALQIVKQRAMIAMECARDGSMSVITDSSREELEAACQSVDGQVSISCYNSEDQFTISGQDVAIEAVEKMILEQGGGVTPMIGSVPFHCPLMSEARDRLEEIMEKVVFYHTRWPVLSNVTGRWHGNPEEIKKGLLDQLVMPVRWLSCMNTLKRFGITMTIEYGGRNVLGNMTGEGIRTLSFDARQDRQEILDTLAKDEIYTKHIPTVITKCLKAAVATPSFCSDEEKYQSGVVEPIERIQAMQNRVEEDERHPRPEEMKQSLDLLKTILTTKEVPEEEQQEWLMEIIQDTGNNYQFDEYLEF